MRVDYQIFLKSPSPTLLAGSGVASPDIFGGEMFDFRRITLFCLKIRLSKYKMTIFSKNVGGAARILLGYAHAGGICPCVCVVYIQISRGKHSVCS